MTKEEALQLIEKNEFTKEKMLEFYEVKNMDGFEAYLESRFDTIDINNEYLVNSFKFMFDSRESEGFNPLEEKYRYYAMVLPGLFGVESYHMQIIVAGIGLFKTIMMLDKMLKDKEEVKYFDYLYKEYVAEMYSIGRTANKYVKLLGKVLQEFLDGNGKESLNRVLEEFLKARTELLSKVE